MRWVQKIILTIFALAIVRSSTAKDVNKFFLSNNVASSVVRLSNARGQDLGCGFVVTRQGYILTNTYIIVNKNKIIATLPDHKTIFAQLIYNDEHNGIALLQIADHHLIPLVLGDSDRAKERDSIWLIKANQQLSHGFITAHQNLFYQMASMKPEDSGCPLFNDQGQVIAINTALDFGLGMRTHFAIPINKARFLIAIMNQKTNNQKQFAFDLPRAISPRETYG